MFETRLASQFQNKSITTWTPFFGYEALPGSSNKARLHLYCSQTCQVRHLRIGLLPSRYRLIQRKLYDGINASPQVFRYGYDEGATNDVAHSAAITSTTQTAWYYVKPYTEFRGHAMSREVGPDGRMTATFYHQDDAKKGRLGVSVQGVEEYYTDFESGTVDFNAWGVDSGGTLTVTRYLGDDALKLSSPSGAKEARRLSCNLGDGEAALLQFQVITNTLQAHLGLASGVYGQPSYRWWGVHASQNGALYAGYQVGSSPAVETLLYNSGEFKTAQWYVLPRFLLTI